MIRLMHNCTHLTCQQINAQNSQARFQQYVNQEHLDVQCRFRKGRGTRDQIASICLIIEKGREFWGGGIYFCFIDYTKALDCVNHNKLWKIIKEIRKRWAFHVVQLVKNPPAMWETPVQFLGQEDPLKKKITTHSSILAWRIPRDREIWQASCYAVAKSQI